MKKIIKLLICLLSAGMLAGCTFTGQNTGLEVDVPTDPVKQTTVDNVDVAGNSDKEENPDGEQGDKTEYNTSFCSYKIISVEENAAHYARVTGFDENFEEIWTYDTPEEMVGQYQSFGEFYVDREGYYYMYANYSVYCFNMKTGEPEWITEIPSHNSLCSTYQDDKNVYILGADALNFYAVDFVTGKIVKQYEKLKLSENSKDYYWQTYMEVVDGKYIAVYFDSYPEGAINQRVFDIDTGEEVEIQVDLNIFNENWKQISMEVEGYEATGDEMDNYLVVSEDFGYISISVHDKDDETPAMYYFDMEPQIYCGAFNYYEEPSEYGSWYIWCNGAEDVSFKIGLLEGDRMMIDMYTGEWTDEQYPTVASFTFVRE